MGQKVPQELIFHGQAFDAPDTSKMVVEEAELEQDLDGAKAIR